MAADDIIAVIKRLGTSLVIHLLIAGVAGATIFWLTSHFEDASIGLRNSYGGAPQLNSNILALLEDARGHFFTWTLLSFLTSFLLSGLFLVAAQRRRPNNSREGRSGRWYWLVLFAVALAAVWALFWLVISRAEAGTSLMFGNLAGITTAVIVGVVLAYYLGTALAVTLTMKPSVPLAGFLPKIWN